MVDIPLEEINKNDIEENKDQPEKQLKSFCPRLSEFCCNANRRKARKRIHRSFFNLGHFIQKHYIGCLVFFGVGLALPCINIKYLRFENDITNMWITSEGRLKEEMDYTRKGIHLKGFGEEEGVFYETLLQVVKNSKDNILNKEILKEHFEMLRDITLLEVRDEHNIVWTLEDICVKFQVPNMFGVDQSMEKTISHLSPCLIMTPLDCFYEGSYIASPIPDSPFDYRKHSPRELLDLYLKNSLYYRKVSMNIKEFFDKAGVLDAYMKKPRLFEEHCDKEKMKNCSIDEKNIGSLLKGGCNGIAENFMHWPQDLIVSGVKTNSSGIIIGAEALQSVISIKSVTDFYNTVDTSKSSEIPGFSKEIASKIIDLWRKEFTALVKRRSKSHYQKSQLLAFSTTSFENMLEKYLAPDWKKILLSCLLMVLYTSIALKRIFQAVYSYGFIGIVAVVLTSVSVILGLAIANLKISVVTTQVLPFLALGLGINNMFLLIRTYIYVCDSGKVNDSDIVGMCLSECGLSITITTTTNIVAFMMASLIPIPTIKEFSFKAAIIVAVTWFSIIFVFTTILAIDVERQKGRNCDILFCFRSDETEEEEDDLKEHSYTNRIQINVKETNSNPEISAIVPLPMSACELFTVQPKTYSENTRGNSTPVCPRKNISNNLASSKRNFNIDPEIESMKKEKKEKNSSKWKRMIENLSLTYFVLNYFGVWITKSKIRMLVLFLFGCHMGFSTYGASLVEQDLDISELIPKDLEEHKFMLYRQNYFPYYKVYIATRNNKDGSMFDYANNQQLLMEFYKKFSKVKNLISPMYSGKPAEFWLPIYRNWLQEIESQLYKEWNGTINHTCVPDCRKASREAKLAYRLLRTLHENIPYGKNEIFKNHLVNDGIIDRRIFYHGLSAWYYNDYLGVIKAQVLLRPKPRPPVIRYTNNIDKAFMASPRLMLIPFEARHMKNSQTIIEFIKAIRGICEEYGKKGLQSYPIGIPFTYWDQFIDLSYYLKIGSCVIVGSVFIFLSITLMCVKAAFIAVFFLAANVFELYGVMGFLNVKLSAIPVVVIALSVGMASEYTTHTMIAFINTPGSREDRTRGALEITFAPMIDTSIVTLIVVAFLSSSPFDYVVKYFFHLMLCLILTLTINGVLVFPVFLSFCGPCAEGGATAIGPVVEPALNIPRSPKKKKNETTTQQRRIPLTTIVEERESSCSNYSDSYKNKSRPETPFICSNIIENKLETVEEIVPDIDCRNINEDWHFPSLHSAGDLSENCRENDVQNIGIKLNNNIQSVPDYSDSYSSCSQKSSKESLNKASYSPFYKNYSPRTAYRETPTTSYRETPKIPRKGNPSCRSDISSNRKYADSRCPCRFNNIHSSRRANRNKCNNCKDSEISGYHKQSSRKLEGGPSQTFRANVSIEFESHSFTSSLNDCSSSLPDVE